VGVFWGQILTRMMEKYIKAGAEYIFTLDYDTWFTRNHAIKMCELMTANPKVDALIAVQTRREGDLPLLGVLDGDGKAARRVDGNELVDVPHELFNKPLTPVATGNFGLSLFRVSSLKKLKKPWFLPEPDSAGGWDKGRTDEDIYFWNNFIASGLTACIANEVMIGHLQLMCTFPGPVQDNWKPIHMYMNNLRKNGPPAHCEPQIELVA